MIMMIDWSVLPDWVQWVAQDADGNWYGYERRPTDGIMHWLEPDGRSEFLPIIFPEWRDSLMQRPESK